MPASQVTLGFRPEALTLDQRPGAAALRGQVELREVLGAEVLLHLRSTAGAITVKADTRAAPRVGDDLTVWLDRSAVHLFDAGTELRL